MTAVPGEPRGSQRFEVTRGAGGAVHFALASAAARCTVATFERATAVVALSGARKDVQAAVFRPEGSSVVLGPGATAALEPGDTLLLAAGRPRGAVSLAGAVVRSVPQARLDVREMAERAHESLAGAAAVAARYAPVPPRGPRRFTAWFRASTAGAARVRDDFGLFCSALHLRQQAVDDVALALTEVLDNVVEHGYRGAAGVVVVQARLAREGGLRVDVRDRAPAFDPLSVPAPDPSPPLAERRAGGLGVHLLKGLVDVVRYERRAGENRLTFHKRIE